MTSENDYIYFVIFNERFGYIKSDGLYGSELIFTPHLNKAEHYTDRRTVYIILEAAIERKSYLMKEEFIIKTFHVKKTDEVDFNSWIRIKKLKKIIEKAKND